MPKKLSDESNNGKKKKKSNIKLYKNDTKPTSEVLNRKKSHRQNTETRRQNFKLFSMRFQYILNTIQIS